jgi:hypothetical protein
MNFIFPPWSRHTNVSGLRPFLCPVKRAPWHMANASCCERFMVVVVVVVVRLRTTNDAQVCEGR